MADLINELARMTAFFQVRTVARVIGADPDRVSRYHRNHGGEEHRRLAIAIDGIVADQAKREVADA